MNAASARVNRGVFIGGTTPGSTVMFEFMMDDIVIFGFEKRF
jgi:cyanophycinase-like exopeptidase